jgi:hypothetical protein
MAVAALMTLVAPTTASCGLDAAFGGDDPGARSPTPRDPVTSAMTPLISLDFDDAEVTGNTMVTGNGGDFSLRTWIASAGESGVTVEDESPGDRYLRFPGVGTTTGPPRAVLVVTARPSASGADRLSPGKRDFEFGATFMLDGTSDNGDLDNGNNLVQRGLSTDPTQYKIQVDHERISCRVAGDGGELLLNSRKRVEPLTWYVARCARVGESVVLEARAVDGGTTERVTADGPTGAVVAAPMTPFAVGGKVTSTGEAVRGNSDQFNGAVDDVFLRVGN